MEKYERPELEVIMIGSSDIITNSDIETPGNRRVKQLPEFNGHLITDMYNERFCDGKAAFSVTHPLL